MSGDTIVAVSSPALGSLRGIVRLSGPEAVALAGEVFRPEGGTLCPEGERAGGWLSSIGWVRGPQGVEVPARCLVMAAPRSYTREDVVELHTLGSLPLLQYVVARLTQAGARLAEGGEFTLRAFLNGRIDLAQAEAVCAVVSACDASAYRRAQRALKGAVGERLAQLRAELTEIRAELEALLNFPEQYGLSVRSEAELAGALRRLSGELHQLAGSGSPRGELPRVVLVGQTNAGKSTLFNALVGAERAVVHSGAGTTLDAVTSEVQFGPYRCILVDTAGQERREDPLVHAGAAAREQECHEAAVLLGVADASLPSLARECERLRRQGSAVVAATKADLAPEVSDADLPPGVLRVSGKTGWGVDRLGQHLAELLGEAFWSPLVSVRQQEAAERAAGALRRAAELAGELELCAFECMSAENALAEIPGERSGEDLVQSIFSRFCIGK